MSKPIRRITVVTGDPRLRDPTKRDARYHEEDAVTHQAMKEAFQSLEGYTFAFLDDHEALLDRLRTQPPDLVVNFCDTGFRNCPTMELNIPAVLELLEIPHTGAPPATMAICYDKALVRLVAQAFGVPVPREHFIGADDPTDRLPDLFPALLKPNTGDGSVGITKDAVVRDSDAAARYLAWLRAAVPGRDALLQEYLAGPEYSIGVIGNVEGELRFLPPLEADFSRLPPELEPILSFESKAVPDSPYWTDIAYRRATLTEKCESEMRGWVRLLFKRLGLRDYARFDFRTGTDGQPKLLEVNPNPAWASDGKLALMAGFAGWQYRDLLVAIVETAIARVTRTG